MEKGITKPSILVVADDFTGANDAGVSLAQVGHTVDVAFEMHYRGDASVWVINSDSRAMDPKLAAMKITSLMSHLPLANNPPLVIKKIDSTLRGNIGAEIEALMTACGITGAVVAPAFPQAGRTTVAGECWVNGVRITETEFASDPKTPVLSARIADIIRLQTAIPGQPVTVSQLSHLSYEQPWISVIMPPPTVLAIIGSMSEIAQRQIATLHSHPCITQIYVDVEHILAGNASDYDARIVQALQKGDHCIVHTCNDSVARHQIDTLCQRWQMSRAALGEKICRFLGELTRQVLLRTMPDALYLSGGDVAMATASALGATGFRITGKVAQCVPYGHFLGGVWSRSVMTKAGGFGDETTLHQVLNFIEEKCSE